MIKNFRVSKTLTSKMESSPLTTSKLVCTSILHSDNVSISEALKDRANDQSHSDDHVTVRLGVSVTNEVNEHIAELAKLTRLSVEEVVRLSIEAYIKNLHSQEENYETPRSLQSPLIGASD